MSASSGKVPPRRLPLRHALAVSALCHVVVLAVPALLWRGPTVGDSGEKPAAADFMVVSLIDSPEASVAPAPAAELPAPAPWPEPAPAEAEAIADDPAPSVEVLPSGGADGGPAAGHGEPATGPGAGAGSEEPALYRPPRLLAGALPMTPQESESLPSPFEIPVRLRVDREGNVVEVLPADPALAPGLREALERSARSMRFVPARLGDEPVEAWFSMSFVYRR